MESGGPSELIRWVSGHSWGRSGSPGSLTGGGRAWPLDRYGRRGNTCLVCDLESVLLAQGWLCRLLEALNGEKREGWSTGGMISLFFPLPPHVGLWTQAWGQQAMRRSLQGCRNGPTGDSGVRKAWVQAPMLPSWVYTTRMPVPACHVSRAVMRLMDEWSKDCL